MKLLLPVFFLFSFPAFAQNLLMNGGFEDENICTEYIKNCAPEGWISTSLKGDYYYHDPVHAFEGSHFVGLVYSVNELRSTSGHKFIRSRLLCSLKPGNRYRLQFFIRSKHAGLDSIGVYFSEDDMLLRKNHLKGLEPALWIRDGLEESFSPGWKKIILEYQAGGHEQFVTFGDFKDQRHDFNTHPDLGMDYYYFLDDVSLVPVNTLESICETAVSIKGEEYAFDARHKMLDRFIYAHRKVPPAITPASPTRISRIDTLLIPDVYFATDSFSLNARAHLLLDSFISRMGHLDADSLVVEGHTDSTGAEKWNIELSANRAKSVGAYLEKKLQILVHTRGWASRRPIADNRDPAGRQRNRRVEIYLYTTE